MQVNLVDIVGCRSVTGIRTRSRRARHLAGVTGILLALSACTGASTSEPSASAAAVRAVGLMVWTTPVEAGAATE